MLTAAWNVDPFTIVAGSPARTIGERRWDLLCELHFIQFPGRKRLHGPNCALTS